MLFSSKAHKKSHLKAELLFNRFFGPLEPLRPPRAWGGPHSLPPTCCGTGGMSPIHAGLAASATVVVVCVALRLRWLQRELRTLEAEGGNELWQDLTLAKWPTAGTSGVLATRRHWGPGASPNAPPPESRKRRSARSPVSGTPRPPRTRSARTQKRRAGRSPGDDATPPDCKSQLAGAWHS